MQDSISIPKQPRSYLPAAGYDVFLPFYDAIGKLVGADRARAALADQARLEPGQHVLDIGCGTGTLAILIKRLHPQLTFVGLDPDPKALARARRKAQKSAVPVPFEEGFSDSLPHPDRSFDHVFSTFMFHHLENGTKEKTLREVRRVLKPGGRLHLLDFGGPESATGSPLSRWLHSRHHLKENSEARILALMATAGLVDSAVVSRQSALFGLGRAVYYRAFAP